jgi:hypothetical protein
MMTDGTRRSNACRSLAVSWIKVRRPDVWEEIVKEAGRQFPRSRPKANLPNLPDSLKNLK